MGKCKFNIVRNGDTKHLCDDMCFERFRADPTTFLIKPDARPGRAARDAGFCSTCRAALAPGKHLLRNGQKFCSQNCFSMSQDDDDVEIVGTSKISGSNERARSAAKVPCGVCGMMKQAKHELEFARKTHRLCSDSCAAAFRFANKMTSQQRNCDSCGKDLKGVSAKENILKMDGRERHFCNSLCVKMFKTKHQRIVACAWCQQKKTNFEMVEKVDGNKVQLFCSLNCLSLFRVNLQATSNKKISCDHCHQLAPAQYHLTMSDASVRNFCAYDCVMAFQAQFQPQGGKAATPGGKGATPGGKGATPGGGRGRGAASSTPAARGRGRGRTKGWLLFLSPPILLLFRVPPARRLRAARVIASNRVRSRS